MRIAFNPINFVRNNNFQRNINSTPAFTSRLSGGDFLVLGDVQIDGDVYEKINRDEEDYHYYVKDIFDHPYYNEEEDNTIQEGDFDETDSNLYVDHDGF